MADEMFRDGFCDDIFRSMKMQMEPSDDVVGSLLAKIAAEAPSSVTENDNVIPFRVPAELEAADTTAAAAVAAVESAPRKQFAKKNKKSIWYYGTAVAASIIVMISTFALLGTDGDDVNNVKDLFQQAVGPDTQIVNPDNFGDETLNSGDETQNPPDEDGQSQDGTGDGNDTQNSQDEKSDEDGNNASVISDDPDSQSGNTTGTDNSSDDGNNTSGNGDQNSNSSDNGKVTPGASGTSDIPWTNEIISTSQVASISVSGSNYVVESTVSRSDVGSALNTVTIDLPQTSTTNAAEVKATVHELKNVSSDAMVVLDVEGFTQPLVYANADYAPATLGTLISDLGLEGNISFSKTVRCQISRVGYSSNHSYNMDISSAAWSYLLNQSGAERASYNSFSNGNAKVLFTSGSNPTASQMQFGVSDNGYLYVSMLGKKHTFHIGAENAKGFIEYVTGEPLE